MAASRIIYSETTFPFEGGWGSGRPATDPSQAPYSTLFAAALSEQAESLPDTASQARRKLPSLAASKLYTIHQTKEID